MKFSKLVLTAVLFSAISFSTAFAHGDAASSKLLSKCKSAIKEYCSDVKNKKDAHEVFMCLEKNEASLKSEKKHKACATAHDAYETAHNVNEAGEEHEHK
jgi:hypothetical protein